MTSRRKDKGKRLSVLTDAEKFALYGEHEKSWGKASYAAIAAPFPSL